MSSYTHIHMYIHIIPFTSFVWIPIPCQRWRFPTEFHPFALRLTQVSTEKVPPDNSNLWPTESLQINCWCLWIRETNLLSWGLCRELDFKLAKRSFFFWMFAWMVPDWRIIDSEFYNRLSTLVVCLGGGFKCFVTPACCDPERVGKSGFKCFLCSSLLMEMI